MYTAIFGGTFNPFHIGHLKMIEALENDPEIEKILVMPDKLPPHKVCSFLADDETRIEMCRIAIEGFKKCDLCFIEFEREGKSYSYDTVKLLKEKYPQTDFAFVCGGDMLVSFDKWYNYNELMKMIPFIVFKRENIDDNLFKEKITEFSKMGMKIILKNEVIPEISSTQLRDDFSNLSRYIPKKIYDFLKKKGIYGAGN